MSGPNVIIIVTDDQGYHDLGCMGAPDIATPHLDALAQRGVRFTDWYANAPVCSPSRAALLTGRYPGRAGVRTILGGGRQTPGLMPQVPTLAGALKKLDYRTGIVGKWHLGVHPECRPLRHGFDSFFGFMSGCIDYFSHIFYHGMAGSDRPQIHDLWENDREIYQNGEYFTDMVTGRALSFLRDKEGPDKPFFLYVGYNAPHYPMHAPQRYMDRFAHLPWERQVMAAMLSAVDDGVGAMVEELKRQNALSNTLIFFMSDNGPSRENRNWMDGNMAPYYGGSAGAFKGHKFSLFEGGIRVPALLSYPDAVPQGRVCNQPLAAMDVFPTVLGLCGGEAGAYQLDGRDMLPVLTQGAPSPHEAIFWECGGQTACRMGKYKLVLEGELEEGAPIDEPVFLSDLSKDPGERQNLCHDLPDLAREMTEKALAWRRETERDWEENRLPSIRALSGV